MTKPTEKINDTLFKWIGIPVTGTFVYHVSGFSPMISKPFGMAFLNYPFFWLISACVWNGSAYIHYLLRHQLSTIKRLYLRIPARFLVTVFATWIISYILLLAWNKLLRNGAISYQGIVFSQMVMVLVSLQISSIYEIVYLNKERESDLIKIERSEKLKAQAQLDALKSQIDPHFIFNSLNTLSYLITNDAQKAKLFNDTLARVYRYILHNRDKDLIQLKEEIEFASNYFYLLRIRYQTGLTLKVEVENTNLEDYCVPPLSLQSLIENAIKHNHFSEKNLLSVCIWVNEHEIRVHNRKQARKFDIQSSGIGLKNLNDRYALTLNRDICIEQNNDSFTVCLPLVKSNVYD